MATNSENPLKTPDTSATVDDKPNTEAKDLASASSVDAEKSTNDTKVAEKVETSTAEQSIVINDPVKVTITVVQEHASSSPLATTIKEKVSELPNLLHTGTSASEQSITINDPVKVTIKVVQGTHEEKTPVDVVSSAVSSVSQTPQQQIDELEKIEKLLDKATSEPNVVGSESITAIKCALLPDEAKTNETVSSVANEQSADDKTNKSEAPTATTDVISAEAKAEEEKPVTTGAAAPDAEQKKTTEVAVDTDKSKVSEESAEKPDPITVTPAATTEEKKEEIAASPAAASVDVNSVTQPSAAPTVSDEKKAESEAAAIPSTSDAEPKKDTQETAAISIAEKTEPKKESEGAAATSATPDAEPKKESQEAAAVSATPDAEPKKESEGAAATSATPDAEPKKESQEAAATSATPDAEPKKESQETAAAPVAISEIVETEQKLEKSPTATVSAADEKKKPEESTLANAPGSTTEDKKETNVAPTTADQDATDTKKETSTATAAVAEPASDEKKEAEKNETVPIVDLAVKSTLQDSEETQDKAENKTAASVEKQDEKATAPSLAAKADESQPELDDFAIVKDNSKNLTDFQRKKAEYFFNVNLDIENKKFLNWEDVEFYLLFHVTAAGKEGAENGELEARLSRAARALWEHIHDKVPSADGKRDKLTLDQFLDTWASLIDYILKNGKLPSLVQNLVDLGFELYSKKNENDKTATIPQSAFEQLFQKMNLDRSYAVIANNFLTENGTKPLDADKVNSIVRAVLTSSDDGHYSHFLLPGFFKTISNKTKEGENVKTDPTPAEKPSTSQDSSSQQTKPATPSPALPSGEKSEPTAQTSAPAAEESKPSSKQQAPLSQQNKSQIEQLEKEVRNILHFYHLDDGDLVEVDDGPVHRLVLVHPERPVPPYIQQNKSIMEQLRDATVVAPVPPPQKKEDSKQNAPLEDRLASGEVRPGPTIPISEVLQGKEQSPSIHQIYPPTEDAKKEEEKKPNELQNDQPTESTKSDNDDKKADTKSSSDETKLSSTEPVAEKPHELTHEQEEKVVETVIKQLTPLVEQLVAAEVRRMLAGGDHENDDDFVQFPFMFASSSPMFVSSHGGPPPQGFPQSSSINNQVNAGGLRQGPMALPPELVMSMMNDLARGGLRDEVHNYSSNVPPPRGPASDPLGYVEGFMMFSDGNPMMGDAFQNQSRFP